jgi:hypothetical protein
MMAPEVRPDPGARDESVAALCRRARSEFLEMPGLRLTTAQATRLWALDRATSVRVLDTLAAAGFLLKNREGAYLRASVA